MERIFVFVCALAWVFGASGRDFATATRLDSIDREIAAARSQLDALDAEHYERNVWGRGRYTSLGFVLLGNTENGVFPREYSSFGFFVNKGTTFLFPKGKGFGSFVKVGVDVRWVDLEVMRYDPVERPLTFSSAEAGGGQGLTRYPAKLSMRRVAFMAGALGVGPSVSIAPFSWSDNGLSSVKLNFYAHYQPTFGLCAYRGTPCDSHGERVKGLARGPWVNEMAYVHMFDFGLRLQWSRYAFGVEGRRARGRFPDETYRWRPADEFSLNCSGQGRYWRRFAGTRICFSVGF